MVTGGDEEPVVLISLNGIGHWHWHSKQLLQKAAARVPLTSPDANHGAQTGTVLEVRVACRPSWRALRHTRDTRARAWARRRRTARPHGVDEREGGSTGPGRLAVGR